MVCPICNIDLLLSEKKGIEIDYCPKCRGIWLDKGELDKIVERSTDIDRGMEFKQRNNDEYSSDYKDHGDESNKYPKRKRSSFLGELFDF